MEPANFFVTNGATTSEMLATISGVKINDRSQTGRPAVIGPSTYCTVVMIG